MSRSKISGLSVTPLSAAAQHIACMSERAFDGAEHLRHAAHGVRVLHAIAILVIAMDLAVRQQQAEAARDFDLMRRAARFLNARVERRVAAGESVDRQRADDDGWRRAAFPRANSPSSASARLSCVPLISARPSFASSAIGSKPAALRHTSAPARRARRHRFAFADQAQRQMRERREIAGGADRAAFRNDRQHVVVEQREQRIDDLRCARPRFRQQGCSP